MEDIEQVSFFNKGIEPFLDYAYFRFKVNVSIGINRSSMDFM
jgi:hypothetical protein